MKKVLISGGSGLVGSRLSKLLTDRNYEVRHLSRSPESGSKYPTFKWDIQKKEIDPNALKDIDYVIHLAGAGIADKAWSAERKKLIIDSRVDSTELLYNAFKTLDKKPEAFISAGAVGYYGDRGEEVLTESSKPGTGFLPESCQAWENAVQSLDQEDIRLVQFRIGIVLSTLGGALEKMLLSFKVRLGTYFGNGKQYYPWIHIDDLCRMFIHAIEHKEMEWIYNAVAPEPQRNKALVKAIARALGKPSLVLPTPEAALRLVMGEMADVVMVSANVSNEKIEGTGFKYDHPDIVPAIKDLLEKKI